MLKSLLNRSFGSPVVRRGLTSVLGLLAVFGWVGALGAQGFDPAKTPVTMVNVPSGWTGALKPTSIVGDSSWWNFGGTPTGAQHPFWHDVDIENGWVFAATGRGMRIYDARTNPGSPEQVGTFNAGISTVPVWHQNDTKFYLFGIDAPAGYDGVAAVAAISGNGMMIFDTRTKTSPRLIYQDDGKEGSQVWSTTFNNTHYAFYAATSDRILIYNLSAALAVTNFNNAQGCLDESPASIFCRDPGGRPVYVGKIPTQSGTNYVHGAGNYLANSMGSLGVEIWRVSDPTSPAKVASFVPPGKSDGVAMWQDGSKYYLAVVQEANVAPRPLRIYDVSCITSGCSGTPPLASTYEMNHSVPAAMLFVTFSRGPGQVPYLFVGGEDQFSGGTQREYLLDVSTPSAPVEVTPAFAPTGYWGWYYFGNVPVSGGNPKGGFNWVMPRSAKLYTASNGNTYLYRAAFSLFDVHQFMGSTPTAGFSYNTPDTSDGKVYRGDRVNFVDASSGNPTSWSWVFPGATPATSNAQSPQAVFNTTGTKTVELQINGNTDPAKAAKQDLLVIDPTPAVAGISIVPAAPRVCQRVSFSGQSVTGKPPLGYVWEILNSDDIPLPGASGTAATFDWNTATTTAGSYKVRLTVNGTGSGSKVVPFTLASPELLPLAGTFLPTNDSFLGAAVQFHLPAALAPSASEWMWDFGDGTAQVWSSDPVTGPNPLHTYAAIGTYHVKVSVRNCLEPLGVISGDLTVNVTQLINLVANFEAFCLGGPCSFSTTDTVPFQDHSTGAAFWDYDWNGDGTFEDTGHTSAVGAHQFTTAGNYRPKLKVRAADGTTTSPVFTLEQQINITQGTQVTPSISVSASLSSPTVGQNVTFTATARNCSPSSSGWTWDTAGGTGTASNSNTITLSWAATGSKTVRASNSSCSGAQGSASVNVGSGGGGGTLKAAFTYTPTTVLQSQPVSFNGSTSTGNPTTYLWDFGDGSAITTGVQVNHTFPQQGTFIVKLTVSAPSSACPPAPFCENTSQQAVVVGSGNPPLSASFNSDICVAELSFVVCRADALAEVTFVDASTGNITSRTWDFGDGETASGTTVKHTYKKAGTYPLILTVSDGSKSESFSRNIIVTGGPTTEAMVLPWIAKTVDGALVQSSDFYLHNPGTTAIDVTLEFRRRGTPETSPPKVTRTIAPNATLFAADVVKGMFGREDVTGFIAVTVAKGDTQPVLMSFNTTFQNDGSEFGQTVPGYLLSNTGAASSTATSQIQHLVGLSDNSERFAYFGLSNPGTNPVTYRLRFFNSQGQAIGTPSEPIVLSRYGAKQYQVKDVRTLFGVTDQDDYRVVVESDKGAPLFPYGANLRLGSNDPSFVAVSSGAARTYLLGALSTPGANNSIWQSDVVIANTSNQVLIAELSFTNVGATSAPTDAITETLQPGETRRLADVIGTKWNVRNGVGVLTIDSDVPGDLFPAIQGESYENTNPGKRYGQTLPALTERQAAGSNQGQYLVGLRQDTKYRTTFWVFNPGARQGEYDVVFRGLDGQELLRTRMTLGAGKVRQFNQAQFPAGVANGFTVQVLVRSGQALSAAQVVNNNTNDPAYIQGETR